MVRMTNHEELLTDAEHALIEKLGECASDWGSIIGSGIPKDRAEFVDKIHQLQHAVMSQVAARAFPRRYRLLGQTHKVADEGSLPDLSM